MKLTYLSATLKKSYKAVTDLNRFSSISKLHTNERLLLFLRWAQLLLGTCCNTLYALACESYTYEMATETSVLDGKSAEMLPRLQNDTRGKL